MSKSNTASNFSADKLKQWINPDEFYSRELCIFPDTTGMPWINGGLCPFHEDHKKGSFFVNLEHGAYKCFSCGEKGHDIISFTQKKHHLGFQETLNKLAQDWGVSIC